MTLSIAVDIDPDHIVLSEPDLNYQFSCANIIAIRTSSKEIVAIGKTESDVEQEAPEAWQDYKSKISFEKIYGPGNFNSKYILYTLLYFAAKIKSVKYPDFFKRVRRAPEVFTLVLTLPSFELIDEKNRDLFELQLPEILRNVRAITINGVSIEIYRFQRGLATWTLRLFIAGGMLFLGCAPALLILRSLSPLFTNAYPNNFLGSVFILVFISIMALIGAFLAIIAWYPLAQFYLPESLFNYLAARLIPKFILRLFKLNRS